jgi:hypothetical protein
MELDELERYCEELPIDMEDLKKYEIRPDFIVFLANKMPMLIAVARAAKCQLAQICADPNYEIHELECALTELEKD